MKTCIIEHCNNPVFTHSYCKQHAYHYYKSNDKVVKNSIKRTPIAKQSLKRIEQNKLYKIVCNSIKLEMIQNNTYRCLFCNKSFGSTEPDWHHCKGRDGELLLSRKYLKPAHNECHVEKYHRGTWESLNEESWFNGFLMRLKEIDEDLYDKEINKQYKK